jgi:hypothetical protein
VTSSPRRCCPAGTAVSCECSWDVSYIQSSVTARSFAVANYNVGSLETTTLTCYVPSAECLCAHHHAVQAMMSCPQPCCMCHSFVVVVGKFWDLHQPRFVQACDQIQVHQTCDSSNSPPAGPKQTAPQRRMCAWPGPVRHVRE